MPSKTTYLKVQNNTSKTITIRISEVDSFDWGKNRPVYNFHNIVIKPHREYIHQEDVNIFAPANLFTLDLIFDNNTSITCRIDQGTASGRKQQFSEYIPNTHVPIVQSIINFTPLIGDIIYSSFQDGERNKLGGIGGDNEEYTADLRVIGETVEVNIH